MLFVQNQLILVQFKRLQKKQKSFEDLHVRRNPVKVGSAGNHAEILKDIETYNR